MRRSIVFALFALACSTAVSSRVHAGDSPAHTACMDTASATSTMLDCMHREEERDDARLNAAYRKVMAASSKQRQSAYRKAQRAWLAFRDAECEAAVDPEGGTAELLARKGCRLELIDARAAHFETIAGRKPL